ncbi:hypothetical protein DL98DRAFT_564266 [Cadophora sp. DSE1049]|nr:hypothetical protein DL98DRAFT_564266 [Cadophora sp. DSE1049]
MAGFADTLRGDGLARAQRTLASLEGDPLRLDRERQRFSHSPLPYTSTTTRSASPIPPSEERRRQRRNQLGGERMGSKPYNQFSAQIKEEEKRVFEADLNGTHRIPVGKWNQFASGRWKHEEPLEIESESETDTEAESSRPPFSFLSKPQPKPRRPKNDEEKRRIAERRVVREPPAIRIFGSPSPFESNHRQVSGALNSSQQGAPADIDPAGSNNSDAERSSSAPNSPLPSSGKRVLHATTGQALLPSKRNASHKDGRPANASLGPVHSAKVAKAAGKREGLQRRLNNSQKADSLLSDVDVAEPQPSPSPDPSCPGVSKDPSGTAASNPSKRAVRSKTERKVANNLTTKSSAKPQGVSKRQPAKTTREKARKR